MDNSEAHFLIGIDTGSKQIGRISWTDASIRGVFSEIALIEGRTVQAHANARQSMLVVVGACQSLPPTLSSTVNILRVDRHLPTGCQPVLSVPQYSIDSGSEYKALTTSSSCRLEAIVTPDDIQRQQALVEVRSWTGIGG